MDLSKLKDAAGINALLDSLRSSSVFTTLDSNLASTSMAVPTTSPSEPFEEPDIEQFPSSEPVVENDDITSDPPVPSEAVSSEVSSLLSRLISIPSSSAASSRPAPSYQSSSAFSMDFSPVASSSRSSPRKSSNASDLRTMSFHQSLPIVGTLLDDTSIRSSLTQMKKRQDDLEKRLWDGRQAILNAQKKRVEAVLATSKITQIPPASRDVEAMRLEFEKELNQYDRDRVLSTWDEHVTSQQVELERLGFPAFFVTAAFADRSRQQRVMDIIDSAMDDAES